MLKKIKSGHVQLIQSDNLGNLFSKSDHSFFNNKIKLNEIYKGQELKYF